MQHPVIQADGELVAVMEFIRNKDSSLGSFYEEDEEIADSYTVWGEGALHYADLYFSVERQKGLGAFLLTVVK